jgi:transposase
VKAKDYAKLGARRYCLGRKRLLSAGSDGGGEYWAVLASPIATCTLNDFEPDAWFTDVLTRIVARHPMGRIDELLTFAYVKTKAPQQAAA